MKLSGHAAVKRLRLYRLLFLGVARALRFAVITAEPSRHEGVFQSALSAKGKHHENSFRRI